MKPLLDKTTPIVIVYGESIVRNSLRAFPVLQIIFAISIFVFAAESSDSEASIEEPVLTSSVPLTYPVSLLKKRVSGSIEQDLYIDTTGRVTHIDIIRGIHPVLDSLASQSAYHYRFTPARENGVPIEVVLRFEQVFDNEHIIQDMSAEPNFSGVIVDQETQNPLRNLLVSIDFIDTVSDTALEITFREYSDLIASAPGQSTIDGKLVTRTDSLGRFSFYLLPVCSLKVRFHPLDYRIFTATESIKNGVVTKARYQVSEKVNYQQESPYEIVVYGRQSTHEKLDMREAEFKYGLTDDINRILSVKSAVNQVPQKGSSFLVQGGSIYDNAYLVCGIPVFPPSHFSNHPSVDISGIMVGVLENVELITARIGGRYANASGCVITMKPGIYRPAEIKLIQRPELVMNVNIKQIDFSLSKPVRNNTGVYQLSTTVAHRFLVQNIGNDEKRVRNACYGLAPPYSFLDLTLTSAYNLKNGDFNSFIWLAIDDYYDSNYFRNLSVIPWGIASFVFTFPQAAPRWRVRFGGSSQQYFEGKQMGVTAPLKCIEHHNALLSIETEEIEHGPFSVAFSGQTEIFDWHGSIYERHKELIHGKSETVFSDALLTHGGRETRVTLRSSFKHTLPNLRYGFDCMTGGIVAYQKIFIDPGFWCTVPLKKGCVDFNAGIVSSNPDIRGIPGNSYRGVIDKTYMASARFEHQLGTDRVNVSVEPYIRYRNPAPAISDDPRFAVWDSASATPVYSRGVNYLLSLSFEKILDIDLGGMVGKSDRLSGSIRMPYEWDVPWSIKALIHLRLLNDWLHIFFNTYASAGIYYRDLDDNDILKRHPFYFRPDLIAEYRTRVIEHRFITRYDLYFGVQNFFGPGNSGEPYWDTSMKQKFIILSPFSFYFGGRFCFRL